MNPAVDPRSVFPHAAAAALVQAAVDLIEVAESVPSPWCGLIARRLYSHIGEPGSTASQGVCVAVMRTSRDGPTEVDCCAAAGPMSEAARQQTIDTWSSAMVAGVLNAVPLKPGLTFGPGWCTVLTPVRSEAAAAVIGVQAHGALATQPVSARVSSLMPAIESSYWRCIGRLSMRRQALLKRLPEAPRRVVQLLAEGFSEREIAVKISKSPHTVHDHVKTIYAVIGATKRSDLIRYWHGLEPVP